MKNRLSNLELLRIVLMFLIVAGHFVGQSGSIANASGFNLMWDYAIGLGGRIAVNGFLILGCYFMVKSSFRSERFVRIWLQELIYTLMITLLIDYISPDDVSNTAIKNAFFPILGFNHWYVSTYLVLILISPFLNVFFKQTREFQRRMLIILSIFICGWATVHPFEDVYMDCIMWFIYVYIFMGYYRAYLELLPSFLSRKKWIITAISIYTILIGINWLTRIGNGGGLYKFLEIAQPWAYQYLMDYKSIPNFVIAFSIFLIFKNTTISQNKLINYFSTSTLAVYIVHQVPVFYNFMWNNIFCAGLFINSIYWPVYMLIVIGYLFLVITLVDKLRIQFIETPFFNLKLVNNLCLKLDRYYIVTQDEEFYNRSKKPTRRGNIKITVVTIIAMILLLLVPFSIKEALREPVEDVSIYFMGETWNADEYVKRGISENEEYFTWTDGENVQFDKILLESSEAMVTINWLDTFGEVQTVSVYVNDKLEDSFIAKGAGTWKKIIKDLNGKAVIRLELSDAVSPQELGLSSDTRKLALQLTEITVQSINNT